MTKTEFREQFKRLRVAGYRLPTFDGVTVDDVMDEWFRTFQDVPRYEFEDAIDRLKKAKTDTFWPATGELWAHIFEVRKARRIRADGSMPTYPETPQDEREQLAQMFREFASKLSAQMAMSKVTVQSEPDHVLREQEDLDRAAEGDACG